MNIQLIYNDPSHQQRAAQMGMDMTAYVANMDPRAIQANIANLSRGPAVYNTREQVDNMRSVGANSGPNAFVSSDQNNPMNEGMLSGPMRRQSAALGGSTAPGALAGPESPVARPNTGTLQAPSQGDLPTTGTSSGYLTSNGAGATSGALTSGGAGPRPNSGPTSGARGTATNNTGNARKSGMPDMRIGRTEQLGRIGTAMVGASQNGLLASMAAGGNAMYAGADQNRDAELAEYTEAERLRTEEQKRRDAIAARNAKGKAKGGTGGLAGGGIYQQATLDAIEAIEGYLDTDDESMNPFLSINGWTGNFLSTKPGRPAHDVAGLLKTVVASIGFDRLDAMRKASKTGGALGSITEGELRLLQSSLGSLQQSSTAPEFRRNLTAVKKHYQSVLASMENDRIADGNLSAAPSQPTGSAPAFNAADYTIEEMT